MKTVKLLVGIPGSGKSTYTKQFPNAVIVSADHYFTNSNGDYNFDKTKLGKAHDECFYLYVKAILEKKDMVIVDNTNAKRRDLFRYLEFANVHKYNVELVYIKCDPEVAFKRNVHEVPLETIQKMHKSIGYLIMDLPSGVTLEVIDNSK